VCAYLPAIGLLTGLLPNSQKVHRQEKDLMISINSD
jgi:hypothetical protein